MTKESSNENVRILIVDDEFSVRHSLTAWFQDEGYTVDVAASGKEALAKLAESQWDIFFLDLKMPGMSGLELQKKIKEIQPESTIIIITAFASVESAVEAMQSGAYDFLSKPFDPDYLALMVRNIVERKKLKEETATLKKTIDGVYTSKEIIGESPGIKKMMEDIRAVADTGSTVLIRGESGTGKELVANIIHYNSRVADGPFVKVNCSALASGVLESELFGHEKGAFTGAIKRKMGRIERAKGGTLFLDEIGDIAAATQVLLLRFLQDHCFERVGGEETLEADVRVLAATNRDLYLEMEADRFRDDLYYRLNVINISLPCLRERKEDIPLLCKHFLKKYNLKEGKEIRSISSSAMQILMDYEWPGNIRQLENSISHAVILAQGQVIEEKHLPYFLKQAKIDFPATSLAENERRLIARVLKQSNWNKHEAARRLNVSRSTLYSKIRRHGLKKNASSV